LPVSASSQLSSAFGSIALLLVVLPPVLVNAADGRPVAE
jgi:hypothetical protein